MARSSKFLRLENTVNMQDPGGTLSFAFQPVFDLPTGGVHHYEALIRTSFPGWNTGNLIEVFEASGTVGLLDRRVLTDISRVADRCLVPIAVNISACSLMDREFHSYVCKVLSQMNAPERLHFEITERQPIAHIPTAQEFISKVRDLGSKISLDDYGVGYMGPDVLKKLDVDFVKIDISIIRGLMRGSKRRLMLDFLAEVIYLSDRIGAQIVAEGIESEDLVRTVRAAGLALGQGYHLGRPLPLPECALAPISEQSGQGLFQHLNLPKRLIG